MANKVNDATYNAATELDGTEDSLKVLYAERQDLQRKMRTLVHQIHHAERQQDYLMDVVATEGVAR